MFLSISLSFYVPGSNQWTQPTELSNQPIHPTELINQPTNQPTNPTELTNQTKSGRWSGVAGAPKIQTVHPLKPRRPWEVWDESRMPGTPWNTYLNRKPISKAKSRSRNRRKIKHVWHPKKSMRKKDTHQGSLNYKYIILCFILKGKKLGRNSTKGNCFAGSRLAQRFRFFQGQVSPADAH